VTKHVSRTRFACVWFTAIAAVPLATLGLGCSPDGTGTINIEDPQSVRAKAEGGNTADKPSTEKRAEALRIEAEAVKKHPKLN
jgi:hypothetical protein